MCYGARLDRLSSIPSAARVSGFARPADRRSPAPARLPPALAGHVFGRDGAQARTVAEAMAKEAFHNVAFFGGTYGDLTSAGYTFVPPTRIMSVSRSLR